MPTVTWSPDATLKDLPAIRRVRTASRSNAGISLLKRRAWFADTDPNPQQPPAGGAVTTPPGGQTPPAPVSYTDDTDISQFPEALQNYIRGVREESKKRRLALEKVDADKAEAERKRLMEQGEWQKLAEQHKAEADSLRSEKARADEYEAELKAINDARIKQIPEALRSTVPTDYTPQKLSAWLNTNLPLLAKTPAPGLDGGKRGESGKTPPNSKDTLKKTAY